MRKLCWLVWLLILIGINGQAANVVVPESLAASVRFTSGYDRQTQASTTYDRMSRAGSYYDSVSASTTNEKEEGTPVASAAFSDFPEFPAAKTETRLLTAPRVTEAPVNVLPSSGGRFIVDSRGNVIPLKPGETFTSSPNAQWIQVRDAAGNPTGLRLDGAHPLRTHPDPRAQVPHGHVPGVTNPDGTPWLPVNQ